MPASQTGYAEKHSAKPPNKKSIWLVIDGAEDEELDELHQQVKDAIGDLTGDRGIRSGIVDIATLNNNVSWVALKYGAPDRSG